MRRRNRTQVRMSLPASHVPGALTARSGGPLQRARASARRQIDLASRNSVRASDARRSPRSKACSRGRTFCARRGQPRARRHRSNIWDPGSWSVAGPGLGSLLAPREALDFGNAGTGSRLMMGVVGGHPLTAVPKRAALVPASRAKWGVPGNPSDHAPRFGCNLVTRRATPFPYCPGTKTENRRGIFRLVLPIPLPLNYASHIGLQSLQARG